jgi:hypothetical protein
MSNQIQGDAQRTGSVALAVAQQRMPQRLDRDAVLQR